MGAWGFRNFENDDAGDWVVDFMSNPNWGFVSITINSFLEGDEMVTEYKALAATEVIAIALNNPPIDLREVDFNLNPIIDKLEKPPQIELIEVSRKLVEKVLKESEFPELVEFDEKAIEERNEILFDLKDRLDYFKK